MKAIGMVGIALVALILAVTWSEAWAKPPTIASPVFKLGQGAVHTAFSPLEIPMSVSKMTKTYGPFWGISTGPINGVLAMIERAASGTVDMLTFYVPAWDQPVLKHRFGETELTDPKGPAVRVGY